MDNSLNYENNYEYIKKHQSISSFLYLGNCNINENDVEFIVDLIKNKPVIQLFLYNNNIGCNGAKFIAELLKINERLKELNLSGNNIGNEGIKYIAESLKICDRKNLKSRLRKLNLGKNNITKDGANFIAKSLENNKYLKELNLNNNNIGDQGIYMMGVEIFQQLTCLDLRHNNISNDAIKFIIESLTVDKKQNLISLKLNGNNIDKKWKILIKKIILTNRTNFEKNYNERKMERFYILMNLYLLKKSWQLEFLEFFNNIIN